MFVMNDDLSIYATRGDIVFFTVSAKDGNMTYKFQPGEIVRMSIYGKKEADVCVMQKDFAVEEVCESVFIFLSEEDTKIGETISKHKDYWYEVVLNPDTMPQTIIGYDEDGAKIFRLFPESAEIEDDYQPSVDDFPVVDTELDMTSPRPVANQAIARAVTTILDTCERTNEAVAKLYVTPEMFGAVGDGVADDTEAIQACIDHAIKNGTVCRIPHGTYGIRNIYIEDDIVFQGADKALSCLKHIGSGEAITVKPVDGTSWTDFPRVTLKNFSIEGNAETEACLRISECIHSTFDSIYIKGGKVGMFIDGTSSTQSNKNSVFNNEYKAISLVNCTEIGLKVDGIISDSHFENMYAENCPVCADMTSVSSHNISFTDGSFIICEKAFYIHGVFNNVRIESFNIEQFSSHGIHIVSDGVNQCKNYMISNCLFYGNKEDALCIEAAKFANSVIWNNNALGVTATHVKLATGCLGVMLMNNQKNSGGEAYFVSDIPATCFSVNYTYDKQDAFKFSAPLKLEKAIVDNMTLVDSSGGHSEVLLHDPYSIVVKKGGYRTYVLPAMTKTQRLALPAPRNGSCVFDTSLGKPVWRAGDAYWVDATGAKVD